MATPTYEEPGLTYDDAVTKYDGGCVAEFTYDTASLAYDEILVTYDGCDHRITTTTQILHLGGRRRMAPRSHGIRVNA